MSDDYVTRNEFNLLNSKVDQVATRVETIDQSGTRGVLALQQQLSDTVKDLAEIKIDLSAFKKDTASSFDAVNRKFDAVDDRFEQERRERTNGRRWAVGIGVAVLGSLGGLYAFLGVLFQHVH